MRVKIDGEHCTGHGRCAKYAPNVFTLDDDGYNAARGGEVDVPAGEEENAKRGMKSCPEQAITLVEA
jgi:ferredoxin